MRQQIRYTLPRLSLVALMLASQQLNSVYAYACKEKIIVIGAGVSGLAAAKKLHDEGCDVTVLEGRDRLGGRIFTSQVGDLTIDMGASWIHGIGKGADGLKEWENKYNPLYQVTLDNKITTLATWQDEGDTESLYFWYKGGETTYDVGTVFKNFENSLEDLQEEADINTSLKDLYSKYDLTKKTSKGDAKVDQNIKDYTLAYFYGFEYAADADQLSGKYIDNDSYFFGPEHIFPDGYIQIPKALAKNLNVILNQKVTKIDYSKDSVNVITENGKVYEADRVVVTVPLAILKSNMITFTPQLPKSKQDSIEKMGAGLMDKLYLEFEDVFWDEEADWLDYISDGNVKWGITLNYYKYTKKPVLLMFNIGKDAREFAEMSDEDVIKQAMETLRTMYPKATDYVAYKRSNWSHDEFARQAYSFVKIGATKKDPLNIASDIDKKIYFAGEHTNFNFLGSAHGAYISGTDAASKIIEDYNSNFEQSLVSNFMYLRFAF
ncbi:amine oxidase [Stylonychia lemnae]|uniref:Amine oxidase n=1 Tax=Stylonychia lemnae TaxID=5949 RepID=A0A078BC38_STYLE|nr:amine oxidase [Stylonychia lemnae]|eukprot:CDW91771.1 amine oxidase [Stylonychia lemnae]